jgi:hypothetical protein
MERMRLAQAQSYPGHILTLHRMHQHGSIAKNFIKPGCFLAARRILEDILDLCLDHDEAQLQLGLVLARLNKGGEAELHMRRLELRHKDHPEAGEIMGQVYRNIWRPRWRGEEELSKRQQKAIETSQLAVASSGGTTLHKDPIPRNT